MLAQDCREFLRVNDKVIERCRIEIEPRWKRLLRSFLIPFVKRQIGFAEVGEGFQWGLPIHVAKGDVRVGRYVYIGAQFAATGPLQIGDMCMISTNVKVVGNDHRIDIVGGPTRLEFNRAERLPTVLEADCWIGEGAIVLAGLRIGRGAVVAAGAVVTRSVEPYSVVAGSPARHTRYRFGPDEIMQHESSLF
jgi:acetyltransferase-like isoleucine patch superfamily enzyme